MTHQSDILVPAYSGRACTVSRGALVRITDVEGCQIGDLFVMRLPETEEQLCPATTRLVNFTPFPRSGESFFSNRRRALLTRLSDTSPGAHDMTFAPCDAELYEHLGAGRGHPNCAENFWEALRSTNITVARRPDPINLFQNTPIADGEYRIGQSTSRPGDSVELRAEADLLIVLTACSVDIEIDGVQPIGGRSTPLKIEIFDHR